jgi:hypothetical protein
VHEFWQLNQTKRHSVDESIARMKEELRTADHEIAKQQLSQFLDPVGFEVRDVSKVKGEPDLLTYGNEAKILLLIEIKHHPNTDTMERLRAVEPIRLLKILSEGAGGVRKAIEFNI